MEFSGKHSFTISLSWPLQMDRQTDRETNTLATRGLEEHFSSCAVVSVFGCGGNSFRWYLPTMPVVPLCLFLLQWEIVFGCTGRFLVVAGKSFRCYFLTYHTSCAVVSAFWLWREIVFGYSVSKKDSHLVSLIEWWTASKCVYFVRSNTLLLCVTLLSIYLLYQKDQ